MREIRWIPVLMAGLWGGALVVLMAGCAPVIPADYTDGALAAREAALVTALDNYCGAVDYRAEVCAVEFEQGFGDAR
jgi:hypothetical protein